MGGTSSSSKSDDCKPSKAAAKHIKQFEKERIKNCYMLQERRLGLKFYVPHMEPIQCSSLFRKRAKAQLLAKIQAEAHIEECPRKYAKITLTDVSTQAGSLDDHSRIEDTKLNPSDQRRTSGCVPETEVKGLPVRALTKKSNSY